MGAVSESEDLKTMQINECGANKHRSIPSIVVSRAKSAGISGEMWLANLDSMVADLERNGTFLSVKPCMEDRTLLLPTLTDGTESNMS